MGKSKLMSVLMAVVIILAIVCLVSFLRIQTADLTPISPEYQDYFRDSSGLPYFTEMDSYYNFRMTEDLINHGHFGNIIVNGTPWDTLSYAPDGRHAEYPPLIAYVTSFLHYVANMFSDVSLKEVAFYTSSIIAPLAAIPAFIIVRRLTNNYGGVAAGLLVTLAPNYFSHTFAGFFDTDMFNVVIPLLLVLFFIESIRSSKFAYRLFFAILTTLSLVVFSLAWDGYIFYVALLVIIMIVYMILGFLFKVDLIQPRSDYSNVLSWFVNQKEIFSVVFIAVLGFIGLGYMNGFNTLIEAPLQLIGLTGLQTTAAATGFPNVAISIGELQIPNLLVGGIEGAFLATSGGVINGIGGIVATFGSFTVLILFALRMLKLHSLKIAKGEDKKLPKWQREATSKVVENKGKESFVESIFDDIKTIADLNKSKRETLLYLTLFSVWIFLSAVAVTQGSRFIMVLMIPLGLCTGLFVGYAVVYVRDNVDNKHIQMAIAIVGALLIVYPIRYILSVFYKLYNLTKFQAEFLIPIAIFLAIIGISALLIYGFKKIKSSKISKTALMVIITLAIIAPTVVGAYQMSQSVVPSTSDPMWNGMLWVNDNTVNGTTMASWWDFGYLFETAAERPTLFDGGSQTGIRAFWTGKAMTTNDTQLSAAIFTMLAHGGDRPSELLDNHTNDSGKTVEILVNTLTLSSEEAKTKMINTYHLTPALANEVVDLTHPDKPQPIIFVASSDMIQKAYWWTFFGNWDFDIKNSTGYQYMASDQPVEAKNIGNGKYQANITNYYDDPIFFQTKITTGSGDNATNATTTAVFENGTPVVVNNTTFNPFSPNKLILIEDGIMWKNETVNASGNYTLLVIGNNKTYSSILMSKELENAMFTKLFILQGFGQDTYELVHAEQGILLWKITGVPTLKNETGGK